MLPRASRAVAAALARRAAAASSSAASEPIAAAASVASLPLVWQQQQQQQQQQPRRALASTAAAAGAATAFAPPPLLRTWRSSSSSSSLLGAPQQQRRSFAAAAAGGNDADKGANKEDEGQEQQQQQAAEDGGAEEAQDASTSKDPEELARELAEARQRVAALTERLQRALAEAENVRQRARRELETKAQFAVADLAKQVLDVADNLWRAEEAVPKPVRDALFGGGGEEEAAAGREGGGADASSSLDAARATALLKALLEGLRATDRGLHELLRKQGIERYDPMGAAFDPNLHAAMFQVPDAKLAPGTVAAVHRRGYMIRDRVLRAAEVGVAREP
jgi:molecular chaperone GrpE